MSLEKDIDNAAEIISKAKRLVAFTGSGVSAESGIATFRDPGGLWDRFDPDEVGTGGGLLSFVMQKPSVAKEFLLEVADSFDKAAPNPGHLALADLEKMGILHTVITQNIDDLHWQAGNTRVIEVHGNLMRFRCLACYSKKKFKKEEVVSLGRNVAAALGKGELQGLLPILPKCPCGSPMRPDVVMFGEAVQDLQQAMDEASKCDVLLILGTSGVVYPAATVPIVARRAQARIIDINPGESAFSTIIDVQIRGNSGKSLPRVLESVKGKLSC